MFEPLTVTQRCSVLQVFSTANLRKDFDSAKFGRYYFCDSLSFFELLFYPEYPAMVALEAIGLEAEAGRSDMVGYFVAVPIGHVGEFGDYVLGSEHMVEIGVKRFGRFVLCEPCIKYCDLSGVHRAPPFRILRSSHAMPQGDRYRQSMAIVRCAATVSSIVMKWKYINAATMQPAINDAFGEKAALMARMAMARMFDTCALDAGAVSVVVFILLMFSDYRQWDKKTAAIPRR